MLQEVDSLVNMTVEEALLLRRSVNQLAEFGEPVDTQAYDMVREAYWALNRARYVVGQALEKLAKR